MEFHAFFAVFEVFWVQQAACVDDYVGLLEPFFAFKVMSSGSPGPAPINTLYSFFTATSVSVLFPVNRNLAFLDDSY